MIPARYPPPLTTSRPSRYAGGLPQPISRFQDRDELTPIPRAHPRATAPRLPAPPHGLLTGRASRRRPLLRSDAPGRPGSRVVPHLHRTRPGRPAELLVSGGPARPGPGRGRRERHLPAGGPAGRPFQCAHRGGAPAPPHPGSPAGAGPGTRRRHPQRCDRLPADRRRRAGGPLPADLPGPHTGGRCGSPAGAHRVGRLRRRRSRPGPGGGRHRGPGLHRLVPLAAAGLVVGLPTGADAPGRRVPRRDPGTAHTHPCPGRGAHQCAPAPGGGVEPTRRHGAAGGQPARHPAHRRPVLALPHHRCRRSSPGASVLRRHRHQ